MAHARISVKTEKRIVSGVITIDPCPEHEVVHVVIENEDVLRASSFALNPKQRQYPMRWIGLPPGLYTLTVTIINQDGKPGGTARGFCSVPL